MAFAIIKAICDQWASINKQDKSQIKKFELTLCDTKDTEDVAA